MAVQLSAGTIAAINNGEKPEDVILQVIAVRKFPTGDRCRLLVSDGVHRCGFAVMATQLNPMINSGEVAQHAVIKVTKYFCSQVSEKKIMIIQGLEVLLTAEDVGGGIGNPTPYESGAAAPAAASNHSNTRPGGEIGNPTPYESGAAAPAAASNHSNTRSSPVANDLIGLCRDASEVATIVQRSTGKELRKKEISIVDHTNRAKPSESKRLCSKCHNQGHYKTTCPMRSTSNRKCSRCHCTGHYRNKCPIGLSPGPPTLNINASVAAAPPASAVSSAASGAAGRGRSPTKQPVSSGAGGREIVKGVCPMPETVPLLDAPHQSSVKERAAAFAVAMGDSEYPESEDSYCAGTEPLSPGPPKPPRTYAEELPPYTDDCMPPPPHDWHSHNDKSYEPCVKPGCLYPTLSDIESLSDKENFPDESSCSSGATVDATCISVDSLGTKILKIAQRHNQRIMTTLPKSAEEMDETEACSDTSGALNVAFCEDSTSQITPPKRHREEQGDTVQGHNQYKTPRISASPSKPVRQPDAPRP
ncbi:uncharacterized protein LOC108677590 isoform X2 [Hyalella azteca]|uniref:Uncharacterized protein LOC108677590 isoform X2 n=1 Tax=Hyalella azteca TaxID=294128 RepID=A0A8B7P843_HYAAZ|nr:uncharacterized protein LOC108677590 isoform X2 [Hyalella azteca]